MRKIYNFLAFSSFVFGNFNLDRIYIFYNENKDYLRDMAGVQRKLYPKIPANLIKEHKETYKKRELGILFEKNLFFEEFDLFSSAVFKTSYNNKGKHNNSLDLRELYIQKELNDNFNLSFGREILSFGTMKSYSILDSLSNSNITDLNDMNLNILGNDGANIKYEKDFSLSSYLYKTKNHKNIFNIIEIYKPYEYHTLKFLLKTEKNKKPIYASSLSFSLNDYNNLNIESSYKNSKLNTIIGLDYTPFSELTLSYEKLFLNSGEDKEERKISLKNLRKKTKKEQKKYFYGLKSKSYDNFFLKYTKDEISLKSLINLNKTDKSKRYIFITEYTIKEYKLSLRYIKYNGTKLSEFGSFPKSKTISLYLSYNFIK